MSRLEPGQIDHLGSYLRCTDLINFNDHAVSLLAGSVTGDDNLDTVRRAFEMVRDRYPHSCDAGKDRVACTASDVIRLGHGLCFAKSNLLAALLRYNGIPAGFCYEKVRRDTDGFVLHGFNAVALDGCWKKIDARGNNDSVQVYFFPHGDMLAYPADISAGELEYPGVYPDPLPDVIRVLRAGPDVSSVILNLPGDLPTND